MRRARAFIGSATGWDFDRSVVAGFLLEAEVSNAQDPGVAQIRAWYDSAIQGHASTSALAKSKAEVMMSQLAQKLSAAVQRQGTAAGAADVARQAVADAKAALPGGSTGLPWWAWALIVAGGGVLTVGAVALARGSSRPTP